MFAATEVTANQVFVVAVAIIAAALLIASRRGPGAMLRVLLIAAVAAPLWAGDWIPVGLADVVGR